MVNKLDGNKRLDANKKPCHDANKKDRMQTKNQKLSRCKQKKDGPKHNSFFATRLISFRREAIRFGGFCRREVGSWKWAGNCY